MTLTDQFEQKVTLVLKPDSVCTPVDVDEGGIFNAEQHLTCFTIKQVKRVLDPDTGRMVKQPKFERQIVLMDNLFEEQLLRLKKGETLCVPSLKTPLGPDDDSRSHASSDDRSGGSHDDESGSDDDS